MKIKNRKKVIALCAAFVATGVGMNVQNAIAYYGMDQDVVSLVASGSSSSGSSSSNSNGGWLGLLPIITNFFSNDEEDHYWGEYNQVCYFHKEINGKSQLVKGTKLGCKDVVSKTPIDPCRIPVPNPCAE